MSRSFLSLILFLLFVGTVAAQSAVFTYQGRFVDSTLPQPTNASYEMEYRLFDSALAGTQIGTTQTISSVGVANGIFTVQLDFGESSFRSSTIYIETSVRPAGSSAVFITLTPRQPVTAAPLAIRSRTSETASTAGNADSLGGLPASNYVLGTDPRMSDDRNPTSASPNYIQNQTIFSQAASFTISGDATIGGSISGNGTNITGLDAANMTAGTLASTRGGTGLNATGSAGNFLKSNGSIWTSSPLAAADLPTGSGNYIQNSAVLQAASNFNISGSGTAAGSLSGGSVNATTQFNLNNVRVLIADTNDNLFAGKLAGAANTSGFSNSFFGNNAGNANTLGGSNSFFGSGSGQHNKTGANNSFFGLLSGVKNIFGSNDSFFGRSAGENNGGDNNSFFGYAAGQANLTGNNNAFFGSFAGFSNTASGNSFFGTSAGQSNVDGANNSFFGNNAGAATTTGDNNSFFGLDAGKLNQTGSQNTYFGSLSGDKNVSGSSNTFVGYGTGPSTATNLIGATAIGVDAEPNGNLNTVIGYQAKSASGVINSTAIGANALVSTSNTIVMGTLSMTTEFPGFVRFLNLASAGSTSLCLNASNQIAGCTPGNRSDAGREQNSTQLKALRDQNQAMQEQIDLQKAQIDQLKQVVCSLDPKAAFCGK